MHSFFGNLRKAPHEINRYIPLEESFNDKNIYLHTGNRCNVNNNQQQERQ